MPRAGSTTAASPGHWPAGLSPCLRMASCPTVMKSPFRHRPARRLALLAFTTALILPRSAPALEVFACEPEWAALVRVLAPQASIHTATHARQDPHHIEARPSLIAALRRAELAVCTGAALESGWLPMLQKRAANPQVQDGAAGMFYAARYVSLIEAHEGLITPFDGDVHPDGNPHLHLDPERLATIASALARRMQQLDPGQAADIGSRHAQWQQQWQQQLSQWRAQTATLHGMPLAVQHGTFSYLWRWLGIEAVADLEPKPGLPPSPGHLQRVLQASRSQPPQAIVTTTYQDPRPAQWLSQQLPQKPPVLQLPATVTDGPDSEAPDLNRLFSHLFRQLLAVRQQAQATPPAAPATPPPGDTAR